MDDQLTALALVQLVARMNADPTSMQARRQELDALLDGANLRPVALHLAGMVLAMAQTARIPLAAFLAAERRDALADGDSGPPGVA